MHVAAQVASVCPENGVCFGLNIPERTAASGEGDIFFQISAPSNYEWVGLGLGNRMAGSNIFVIYTSANGNNVTLSPRSAAGYSLPAYNSNADVALLEGSGVSDGKMVANVRCTCPGYFYWVFLRDKQALAVEAGLAIRQTSQLKVETEIGRAHV